MNTQNNSYQKFLIIWIGELLDETLFTKAGGMVQLAAYALAGPLADNVLSKLEI